MLDLLSWNVLADAYVRADYFPSTPPALLAPGARTNAILARLVASDADVICLQEVEQPLVDRLRGLDVFDVHFAQKGRDKPDGCAILARRGSASIEATRALHYPDGSGHVALLAWVRARDQLVGVATTHAKWDPPNTPESERWATRQLAAFVAAMRAWRLSPSWVACGDFNVTPDDPALGAFEGFRDVYAGTEEARPTINGNGRARRIDFVFAEARLHASPRAVREIDATTPMPSTDEPSDHLAIGARIEP